MIICCGEALIDFIPTPDGKSYRPCAGGSILNIAVGLGRLQVPVGFLSRLSTDIFGDQLAEYMTKDGVDLSFCPRVKAQTTLAFVKLSEHEDEEPQYAFYTEGAADRMMTLDDLPQVIDDHVQALHFGSISLLLEPGASALEALMKRESRRRILTLDPNVRPGLIADPESYRMRFESWISLIDILRLSEVDFDFLYPEKDFRELLPIWFENGLQLVILTLGEKGAVGYLPDGTEATAVAPRITVKDTVGAGDTFFAAALAYLYDYGLLANRELIAGMGKKSLESCLQYAVKAAAINCTREGANPPYKHEMD